MANYGRLKTNMSWMTFEHECTKRTGLDGDLATSGDDTGAAPLVFPFCSRVVSGFCPSSSFSPASIMVTLILAVDNIFSISSEGGGRPCAFRSSSFANGADVSRIIRYESNIWTGVSLRARNFIISVYLHKIEGGRWWGWNFARRRSTAILCLRRL